MHLHLQTLVTGGCFLSWSTSLLPAGELCQPLQLLVHSPTPSPALATSMSGVRGDCPHSAHLHKTTQLGQCLQVVDSPFSRLTDLMLELVEEQKIPIPRYLMKVALSMMRRSVRKRAKFNINDVAPLAVVPQLQIPILYGECPSCSGW